MMKSKKYFITGFIIIVVASAILLSFYFWNSEGKANLSQLGDFLSGTLGLLLTVIFAVIAYYTYKQQVSTTQRQSFDDKFIKMLELHIGYSKTVKYKNEAAPNREGYETFRYLYEEFRRMYERSIWPPADIDLPADKNTGLTKIQNTYEEFNNKYIEITGPFIKHIYYLLRYIDDNRFVNEVEKIHYAKMVRTEISQYEALILFYAGLSKRGYPTLKPLLENYSILSQVKHVKDKLINAEHLTLYNANK